MRACCSIGVIAEKEPPSEEAKQQKQDKEAEIGVQKCNVFGMEIKALTEDGEPRALDSSGSGDKAVEPNKVQQYLRRSFGTRYRDHVFLQAESIAPPSICPFLLPSQTLSFLDLLFYSPSMNASQVPCSQVLYMLFL